MTVYLLDRPCKVVYQFARTSITQHYRLGGLSNRKLFSPGFGGCKFKIEVLVNLDSSEASLVSWQMASFSLYPHMAPFFLCLHTPRVLLCVQISSLYKGLGQIA